MRYVGHDERHLDDGHGDAHDYVGDGQAPDGGPWVVPVLVLGLAVNHEEDRLVVHTGRLHPACHVVC